MTTLDDLPLRPDLQGKTPYGAPQLDVAVRLNVNENAYPIPTPVVEAMNTAVAATLPDLNRYPDREFTTLREHLADYLNEILQRETAPDDATDTAASAEHRTIAPEQIWAANGSNEVLSHILQAFGGPGRIALGFTPSYSMHPLITQASGAQWLAVQRAADFSLPRDEAVAAVREVDPHIVFLCTPNNPTGTALSLDVIEAVYDACDGIVIVDEAYAEFSRPGTRSALNLLPGRERLVVSRTMSKAFAFAGVRLGYAAADPALIDALRLVRLPYHLSAPTQALASAALTHSDTMLANVDKLIAQRDTISLALAELGFSVVPSDSNFVLFGNIASPQELWQDLLERDVLIRDIGIDHHLRVNAGTEEETAAFIAAIHAAVAAHPEHLLAH